MNTVKLSELYEDYNNALDLVRDDVGMAWTILSKIEDEGIKRCDIIAPLECCLKEALNSCELYEKC